MSVRCLYLDLDGTLLGRGASLVHDGEGNLSFEGLRALQACLRADVEIVLMSGRRRAQVAEDARLLGQDAYTFEAGACVVLGASTLAPPSAGVGAGVTQHASPGAVPDATAGTAPGVPGAPAGAVPGAPAGAVPGAPAGAVPGAPAGGEEHWLTGELLPGELTIAQQIERSGAPALLLERYKGRLEHHEPWHRNREVSHLFRGLVDAFEVDALLAEHGFAHLRMVDNGVVQRRSEALAHLPYVRAYHLVPAGASKAAAAAFHRRVRGYAREETFAVGDSREDLACAAHVGSFWLVANAVERDPTMREAISGMENVRVAESAHGAGVYEAVVSTLVVTR